MTNFAFELDPLELEEEEAELGEHGGSAKTSVSSVTTPPPHGKRIPFFKKVIPSGFLSRPSSWQRRGCSSTDVVHSLLQVSGLSV